MIFLSGYGRDDTISRALEIGAADYIVKPFSPTELVARIQAALRKQGVPPEPYQAGDLVINYEERRVSLASHTLHLTATEYEGERFSWRVAADRQLHADGCARSTRRCVASSPF